MPTSATLTSTPTDHFETYPSGVLVTKEPSNPMFLGLQCLEVHKEEYDKPFDAEEILRPFVDSNSHFFIGARRIDNQMIELGAFGRCSKVIEQTKLNKPHSSNDVYWYYTPKDSFGFLDSKELVQTFGDVGTKSPASRLSWSAKRASDGGHSRAGSQIDSQTKYFEKVVYLCTANKQDEHERRGASLVMSYVL
jgi:hypothetical protein